MNEKNLLRTVLYLHHKLERAARESELSISQYRMLYFLSKGSRRAVELAMEGSIRKPSITALINTLEKRGYIERQESAEDRRAQDIRLTSSGRQAMIDFEADLQAELSSFLGEEALREADEMTAPLYEAWNSRKRAEYAN